MFVLMVGCMVGFEVGGFWFTWVVMFDCFVICALDDFGGL